MLQLVINLLFALWILYILDIDLTGKGHQLFKAGVIAFIFVYWRMGHMIVRDERMYHSLLIFFLFGATMFKHASEK